MSASPHIRIEGLEMRYGSTLIQRDLSFDIQRKDIFVIMGGSGCGKSTLLKHMIGLYRPAAGRILYDDLSFWDCSAEQRADKLRYFGISYQSGALISSLTVAENVAMPLALHTSLTPAELRDLVSFKLALVGLSGIEDYYPSEISGGMLKRAALARAIALEPEILFFDEPSAGLDPVSAHLLDELIVKLRDSLNATIVIVTHELASIFDISNNAVFLDPVSKTMLAYGDPKQMRETSDNPTVRTFLRRGVVEETATQPHHQDAEE